MDRQELEEIRKKQKYNELLFQITQYNLRKGKAPDKIIEKAKKLGRQLNISETELKNIEFTKF